MYVQRVVVSKLKEYIFKTNYFVYCQEGFTMLDMSQTLCHLSPKFINFSLEIIGT